MYRFATILASLSLALTLQAAGQESGTVKMPEARLAKAEKNYLACLSSENNGVVESGIAMAARLRVLYPERGLSGFREKLADLAFHGPTASIRYKAYLVSFVLDDRGGLPAASEIAMLDNSELFSFLAGRLQSSLLGYSAR